MIYDLIDELYHLGEKIEKEMARAFPVEKKLMYRKGNMKAWAFGTVIRTGHDTEIWVRTTKTGKERKISVFDVRKQDVLR